LIIFLNRVQLAAIKGSARSASPFANPAGYIAIIFSAPNVVD